MAIHKVRRGGRVYLSEYKKIREGKKVKSVFVRYLGPEDHVKQGKKPKRRVLDRIQLSQSHRAGDIRLLWKVAEDLDLVNSIDRICCEKSDISGPSPGKFLTMWAINRVLDPESCTRLERWVPTTDLPLLAGVEPELCTKDAFLSSMDFVCYSDPGSDRKVDHTVTIDELLYHRWRSHHPLPPGDRETVAYDLTSVLFFGVSCPLAELGYNTKGVRRHQVNLALLVSRYDKYPITHFVYGGSRNIASTVKNLLVRLMDAGVEKGTIIWDRGNVSKDHVKLVEDAGWKLICGVPATSKEACAFLDGTEVPVTPEAFVQRSKTGHIYAVKTKGQLFGRERSVVVCINEERRSGRMNDQNEVLAWIGEELDKLSVRGQGWSEAALHKEIKGIVGSLEDLVHVRVKRIKGGVGPRIEWWFKTREIEDAARPQGKSLLLSTDESLPAKEVVRSYFEKDFVEKVFRMLKTDEEMEPVRHRLEHRVRAYLFVCVLAYHLLSALHFRMKATVKTDNVKVWEQTFDFLDDLGRVERAEIRFGNEVKTLYLNVSKSTGEMLKKIGMKDLLKEESRLMV